MTSVCDSRGHSPLRPTTEFTDSKMSNGKTSTDFSSPYAMEIGDQKISTSFMSGVKRKMSSSLSPSPVTTPRANSVTPPPTSTGITTPSTTQHQSSSQTQHSGVPRVAPNTRYTAPVHIDVGGQIYTSTLETLTKFPESRLSKLFTGHIPIILDSLKQHYFIDRDGHLFRYILNYMRTARLLLPGDFTEMEALYEEARYYNLTPMMEALEQMKSSEESSKTTQEKREKTPAIKLESGCTGNECVIVHTSPDCVERISLSGDKNIIYELFPEVGSIICNSSPTAAGWAQDSNYVIRFPLNGFCKMNTVQVLQRLLQNNFGVIASSGGGIEGSQFSEYVLSRKYGQLT
ncbi:BTB/POZ domain-containing protein kctd15-like [Strongylocentrotus purpuratus]|uniref:BTB domain-containing protein n=1 Tax=Strongylocentrotus purpuratus TaxID=7668 RepID=A0A7M7GGT5_STRPU|nr:BTB/POZ domain-containing protein kctd15-like [Strongylocentrotus purpuratus]|eukprot:XP_003726136.1 PREDICTED: BTB/POZ domain-containing protein kctd15-like [Strongylocentrotus purpuratus]